MKNHTKTQLEVNWLKGLKMETKDNAFLTICIGLSLLIGSLGTASYLIIRAIAPHGFF